MGIMLDLVAILFQGSICFWRGNIKWINSEIQLFRPTVIGLVPRLLNRI